MVVIIPETVVVTVNLDVMKDTEEFGSDRVPPSPLETVLPIPELMIVDTLVVASAELCSLTN